MINIEKEIDKDFGKNIPNNIVGEDVCLPSKSSIEFKR